MITHKTGPKFNDVFRFATLEVFDGRVIKGTNLDFVTVIPISSFEHRQTKDYLQFRAGRKVPFVHAQPNGSTMDFFITDDWGDTHLLMIPIEETETIEKAKAAILQNRIPNNFQS